MPVPFETDNPPQILPGGSQSTTPNWLEDEGQIEDTSVTPEWLREPDRSAQQSLNTVRDVNPDNAARARRLGTEEDASPEELSELERQQTIDQLPPSAQEWLSVPENAAVIHDQPQELGTIERLSRGVIQSAANLWGGAFRVSATLRQQMLGEDDPIAQSGLQFAEALESYDGGYKPKHDWERFKNDPLREFLPFAIEQGLVSLPHMIGAGVPLLTPFYVAARTGQLGQERAESDLREDATVEDFLLTLPTATASALLERVGVRGITGIGQASVRGVRQVPGAVTRGVVLEAGTEFLQESAESATTTVGTEQGFDLFTTLEEGLAGSVAGAGFGGTTRAVTATTEATLNSVRARRQQAQLTQLAETLNNSQLAKRSPEKAAEYTATVMEEAGVSEFFVDPDILDEWIGDDHALRGRLGVEEGMIEASLLGQDVAISSERFIQHILQSERYSEIEENVKTSQDSMSPAEAQEYESVGVQEDLKDVEQQQDIQSIEARHASPHRFEQFNLENIGTGEGAAAFGFGLYFTQGPEAHNHYLAQFSEEGQEATSYGVRITASEDQLLNQDATLSEQSAFIKERLKPHLGIVEGATTGQALIQELQDGVREGIGPAWDWFKNNREKVSPDVLDSANRSPAIVSSFLRDIGIPGSRYLDEKSREAGEGTDNLVIFDDSIIQMTDINGEPVQKAETESPVDVAEHEFGLQALFSTAQEAGMTPKEFERYLDAREKARDSKIKNVEEQENKRELQQNTEEIRQAREQIREQVRETLDNERVYAAFNGIGTQRLNREQVKATADEMEFALEDIPKQGTRVIYTTQKDEPGIDIDFHAQIYDYKSGAEMLVDMATAPRYRDELNGRTEQELRNRFPDLFARQDEILEALRTLSNDQTASMIAMEVDALRGARADNRLSRRKLKSLVQQRLSNTTIQDIKPRKLANAIKKHGKDARRAVRRGDLETAASSKFNQLLNYKMLQEVWKVQDKLSRQRKFLEKFLRKRKAHRNLPTEHLSDIRSILTNISLSNKLNKKLDKELKAVDNQTDPVDPNTIRHFDPPRNWQEMKLKEFNEVHDLVKDIQKKGLEKNNFRKEQEKEKVDATVAVVTDAISRNLSNKRNRKNLVEEQNRWENAKNFPRAILAQLFNTDTVLRKLDNWKDLGPVYQALKGRFDDAYYNGYHPGQRGYVSRHHEELKEIENLFGWLSKKQKRDFNKPRKLEGTDERISHHKRLSILLNSGNDNNIKAMLESKTISEDILTQIWDTSSKQDWEFAQSVWDYLDKFFPEITEAEKRRRNYVPEKVQAIPIQTPHGQFRGGYFPIVYDKKDAAMFSEDNVDEFFEDARFGRHVQSHTARGHTEQRTNPGKFRLRLDVGIIPSHVNKVVYDLEVGDAITDIYKTLFHKDTKAAFAEKGYKHYWEFLDTWFRDAVTGERGTTDVSDGALRWLRTGFTVSKLGWNTGTIAVQVFGIAQSSTLIGKRNIWHGMRAFAASPLKSSNAIDEMSPLMAARQFNWQKDMMDAYNSMNSRFIEGITPGNSFEIAKLSMFYGITKAQRMVDVITWLGAKKQGMDKFNGDEKKAVRHADRMVVRTQASGVFTERTPLERGSLGTAQQQEWIRAFTPLISYFAAKNNVAFERTSNTNFKNPIQAIDWAIDMFLLYSFEAILIGIARGQFPDDDDDRSTLAWVAGETVATALSGVVGARDAVSTFKGFDPGSTFTHLFMNLGKAATQFEQGEFDEAFFKSLNRVGGQLLHYPSSQARRTYDLLQEEELEPTEYIFGPHYDED